MLTACQQAPSKSTGTPISRSLDGHSLSLNNPPHRTRAPYTWEERYLGNFPKITKEYFRCKGNSRHPIDVGRNLRGDAICLADCGGSDQHSLPVQEGKEHIYPILMALLNHLQTTLNRRVIVTCGHRCPSHNSYADRVGKIQSSKHLIAAEVDFYLQGLEYEPELVVEQLLNYYKEDEPSYQNFTHPQPNIWQNREIKIKTHAKDEDRDLDNQHAYPYLTVELLYDRDTNRRVNYSWQKAFNGYMRW
ncbi:MAG: hypothetical protein SNF33_05540 [Candidatus Algichlamydia australiensis]|nr:hypothetical protein [Chlamydiales bacterium]